MDYWSRVILASIMGFGVGLAISYFFGNAFFWIFISLAFALATETSLRTVKNVNLPPNPIIGKSGENQHPTNKLPPQKPPKPNF